MARGGDPTFCLSTLFSLQCTLSKSLGILFRSARSWTPNLYFKHCNCSNCSLLSVADGTTQEDPILGTEPPSMDYHVMEFVQEDIDPLLADSSDVDPVQDDLLKEMYTKTQLM